MTAEEIITPDLPVGEAAQALLKADPILGSIVIILVAALMVGMVIFWRVVLAKDKELAEAKEAHIADLKLSIPAMHELRETILAAITPRGRTR